VSRWVHAMSSVLMGVKEWRVLRLRELLSV
jgi:hypothetical protein